MISLPLILALSALLFCLGLAIVLCRANAILMIIGVELMLGAANMNFIAFWRFGPQPDDLTGLLFVLFSIAIAAAEAAIGLALIVRFYRHFKTVEVNTIANLRN